MVHWDIFAAVVAMAAVPLMLSPSAIWLLRTVMEPLLHRLLALFWPASVRCERLQWEDIPDGQLCVHTPVTEWTSLCKVGHRPVDCLNSTIGSVFSRAWVSVQRREKWVKKPVGLDLRTSYVRTDVQTLKAYLMLVERDDLLYFGLDVDQSPVHFKQVRNVLTAHLTTRSTTYDAPCCLMTKDDLDCLLHGCPPFYRKTFSLTDGGIARDSSQTPELGPSLTSPIKDPSDIPRAGWIVACGLSDFPPVGLHTMAPSDKPSENCFWKDTVVRSSFRRFYRALENLKSAFPDDEIAAKGPEVYQAFFVEENERGSNNQLLWWSLGCEPPVSFIRYERKLTIEQWAVVMTCFNRWDPLTIDEIHALQGVRMQFVLVAAFQGILKVLDYGRWSKSNSLPSFPELRGHKYVYLTACRDDDDEK